MLSLRRKSNESTMAVRDFSTIEMYIDQLMKQYTGNINNSQSQQR